MAFVVHAAPLGRTRASSSSSFVARAPLRIAMSAPSRRRANIVFAMADEGDAEAAAATEATSSEPEAAAAEPEAAAAPEAAAKPVAVAEPEAVAEAAPDAEPQAAAAAADTPASEKKQRRSNRRGGKPKREITLKLEDMEVGQEIEGIVKSTTAYGAFVGEMGTPTDGLLHVSQLAEGYVANVTDVVSVGDKIKVRVLSIDMEKGNFSLTMKPPQTPEQAAAAAEKRAAGGGRGGGGGGGGGGGNAGEAAKKWDNFTFDTSVYVDAKVVSVAGFGAFCKLLDAEGNEDASVPTDGLIHISEISDERIEDVESVLSVGQTVKARVTATDRKRNRISLSLKEPKPDEGGNLAEDMAASEDKQPVFKTTMELAFERAKAN